MLILSSPIFVDYILPFVLIFVVIFAILQRAKILGEGKTQMDALVALVIGLLVIVVPPARDIIVKIMPWLAVAVAVILVFIILYGFVAGDKWAGEKWMRIVFGILAGIFVIILVLWATGGLDVVTNTLSGRGGGEWLINILVIVIIGGAIAAVIAGSKKRTNGGSKD